MVKALTRTVFVGTFRHAVDAKHRLAIPAKWRAAAKNSREFYVLPVPRNCLVVLPESAIARMMEGADEISLGDYQRRDALRQITANAQGTPCDRQGRIVLTPDLMEHAGITEEAVLVGVLTKFEIWSPARYAEVASSSPQAFEEAVKQLGI